MDKCWVVNASPIITLGKIEQLKLLENLTQELCIPEQVAEEILDGPIDDPARKSLGDGWKKPYMPVEISDLVLGWSLGQGESSVLSFAQTRSGTVAVLDDAEARKCARTLNIPVIGTLGVVLRAKQKNLIPSAAEVLKSLRASGLYLDDQIVGPALKQITGEDWL